MGGNEGGADEQGGSLERVDVDSWAKGNLTWTARPVDVGVMSTRVGPLLCRKKLGKKVLKWLRDRHGKRYYTPHRLLALLLLCK